MIINENNMLIRYFEEDIDVINEKQHVSTNNQIQLEYIPNLDLETLNFEIEKKLKEINDKKLIDNILFLTPEEVYFGIGGGKSGSNAQKAYKKILEEITLIDIIKTCNFKLCGEKAAIQIEKFLTGQSYDFNHLPSISYE